MTLAPDVLDIVNDMKARGEPFALATVVRTVSLTAAKAGAKAVILRDGTMTAGWIGGGCARANVLKAARQSLSDGQPRLISVQPKDVLEEHGLKAGESHDGVLYANNMCPSHGTMGYFCRTDPAASAALCLRRIACGGGDRGHRPAHGILRISVRPSRGSCAVRRYRSACGWL